MEYEVEDGGGDFVCPAYNYRLTEIQAAIGCVQMRKLDQLIKERRQQASNYDMLLRDSACQVPFVDTRGEHVYQSYAIGLPERLVPKRAALIQTLKEHGIETSIGTYCMPQMRWFRRRYNWRPNQYPSGENAYKQLLVLPLFSGMSISQQEAVIRAIIKYGNL